MIVPRRCTTSAAFSLIEVLIAIFILGIGLIMVASIFPVAATWTRQATEETIAGQVALNASHILKLKLTANGFRWNAESRYQPDSMVVCDGSIYKASRQNHGAAQKPPAGYWTKMDGASTSTVATIADIRALLTDTWSVSKTYIIGDKVYFAGNEYEAIVGSTGVAPSDVTYWRNNGPAGVTATPYIFPVTERAFVFGSDQPYPATTAGAALNARYMWTAILKSVGNDEVVVYICVFRKTDAEQTWGVTPAGWGADDEISGARLPNETGMPALVLQPYDRDENSFDSHNQLSCVPPLGFTGIGVISGVVFKQGLTADSYCACPTVFLQGQTSNQNSDGVKDISEKIIYAPAADHAEGSPLVYVHQARLSF